MDGMLTHNFNFNIMFMKEENKLNLGGVIKSVCEHSWINTGMTLQGVTLKMCMKCGKTEQTVLKH